MAEYRYQKRPCSECPWRRDVELGRFSPERFELLASTAYDMSETHFACHKTTEGQEAVCAGFLLRGADHHLRVRIRTIQGDLRREEIADGGYPLFDNYKDMAIANGVDPDDPVLIACR